MKKLAIISLLAIAGAFAWCNRVTAFKSGEYIDHRRNVKVCVYHWGNKNFNYSVATYNICPITKIAGRKMPPFRVA